MSDGEKTAEDVFSEFSEYIDKAIGGVKPGGEPNEPAQDANDDAAVAAESQVDTPDAGDRAVAEGEQHEPASTTEDTESDPAGGSGAEPDAPSADAEVDWEKRYKDLQSHKDRQLFEMQRQLDQVTGAVSAQMQTQQPGQFDPAELEEVVKEDRHNAFGWALNNAPELLPQVIGLIAKHHGEVEAEQARFTVIELQQQSMMQMQHQQQAQAEAPAIIERGIMEVVEDVRSSDPEAFDELRDETANLIRQSWQSYTEQMGHPPAPDQWHSLVENSFLHAFKGRTVNSQQASGPQRIEPTPQNHIEMGNARTVGAPSAADSIAEGIMREYERSPHYKTGS